MGEIVLNEGTDYDVSYSDNVEIGTAKAVITGQMDFDGTAELYFSIVPRDISGIQVEQIAALPYDGTAKVPAPVVKDGKKTLEDGEDYLISYQNNVNAGTADVILEGTGNYRGTRTVQFEILPIDISDAVVEPIEEQTYAGQEIEPVVLRTSMPWRDDPASQVRSGISQSPRVTSSRHTEPRRSGSPSASTDTSDR